MPQTIKFRQGTRAALLGIVPQNGEPCWTTDTKQLYIGDGATAGGVASAGGINTGSSSALNTQVVRSGEFYLETDSLQRLRIGDDSYGGRPLNNASFARFNNQTNGYNFANQENDFGIRGLEPRLIVPIKVGTQYIIDAFLIARTGPSPTGAGTPTMSLFLYGLTTYRCSVSVTQNVSATPGTWNDTVTKTCVMNGTITLPEAPSGGTNIVHISIKGHGSTNNPNSNGSGLMSAGFKITQNIGNATRTDIINGSYFNLTECAVTKPLLTYSSINNGSNITSGSTITGEIYPVAYPTLSSLTYQWYSNNTAIPGQSGSAVTTGPYYATFVATGYPVGTRIGIQWTAVNSEGTGIDYHSGQYIV